MTRAQLLSLIMFDIGLPIIDAITKVVPLEDQERANASVAALLDKTIFNSDEIQDTLDISEDDMANVYVRISMASIAARIIALQYERTGKSPTVADIKRYVSSLDTLQTFSDRYILGESLSKLYALESPEATRALRNMTKLSYLESFAPMIDVVVNFSFGQQTQKMIQDVSERLRKAAEKARVDILGTGYTNNQIKASELAILKVMVDLYCTCHTRETKLIMELDEDERGEETMSKHIESIWSSFDNRLTMLTVLSDSIMPDEPDEELDVLMKKIEEGITDLSGPTLNDALGIKNDDSIVFEDTSSKNAQQTEDKSEGGGAKTGGNQGAKKPAIFSMFGSGGDQAEETKSQESTEAEQQDNAVAAEQPAEEEPDNVEPLVAQRASTLASTQKEEDDKTGDDDGDASGDIIPKKPPSPLSFYVDKSESA